jgi:hypothetical protein
MSEPERWMFEEGDLTSLKDDSWTPLEVIEPDPTDRLMKSARYGRSVADGTRLAPGEQRRATLNLYAPL